MAGMVGLIRWDRAPVRHDHIVAMLHAAPHRGTVGAVWVGDAAGAGVYVSASGATSLRVDAKNRRAVVLHGRLDNASDLAGVLGLPCITPDAEVILAAYDRWGEAVAPRLLGAFAFVIWDPSRRAIFAARDAFGLRPLVYTVTERMFAWASDLAPLVRLRQPRINEGMVGEFLSDRITSLSETVFEDILRLPMAHALDATPSRTIVSRYWTPTIGSATRRSAAALEAQLRERLGDAACRSVRDRRQTVLLLSGGIDSSAIAAALTWRGRTDLDRASISATTLVFPGHPASEERFASEAARHTRLRWDVVAAGQPAPDDFEGDATATLDLPEPPPSVGVRPLHRHVRTSGADVIVTGHGGDEWFFGNDLGASDLLAAGRLVALGRWVADNRRLSVRAPTLTLLRHTCWGALSPAVRRRVRGALGVRAVPPWIDARFAARVSLEDRLRAEPPRLEAPSRESGEVFALATDGESAHRLELQERAAARAGLELRLPFYDRPLVEFALSLPTDQRRHRVPKAILRRVLSESLPPLVVDRVQSADFRFLFVDALNRLLRRRNPVRRLARRGWIVGPEAERLFTGIRTGATRDAWPAWAMVAVEFWAGAVDASETG